MSSFLISCGGTGGHLSPGISLAEGLIARGHKVALLISRKRVDARLAEKYPQFEFIRVQGTGFSWNPFQLMRCCWTQTQGLVMCMRLVRARRPDGIIGFGGFTSAALAATGWLLNVPVALHESNRVPGLAIRMLGRLAKRIYLPNGVQMRRVRRRRIRSMGMPVRSEIRRLPVAKARATLGLAPEQKVLVVIGGSQGSSPLNEFVTNNLRLFAAEGIQVYCVTGLGKGEPAVQEFRTKNGASIRSIFVPFCDQVAEMLSAADLVVSRAGAGTIAELIRCETPAILVPYPMAADDHQRANASFFERQGGGIVVEQSRIGYLQSEVLELIFNSWLLTIFRSNLQRMDRANSLAFMLADIEELSLKPPDRPAAHSLPA